MAEPSGRQPFRFRFPWMTSTVPTGSRPPFRPPGVAPPPPRPSSQPQATQTWTESRPPSPARTASQPSSPAKRLPSLPPSPVRTSPQSRVISLPSSPSKTDPSTSQSQPQTAPQTPPRTVTWPPSPSPSPSPTPSKPQQSPLATVTSLQPPSPARTTSQQEVATSKALTPPLSPPRSPASQTELPTRLPERSPDQKTEPRQEKKVSPIIPIDDERKHTATPELPHRASGSNVQSEEEERQRTNPALVHETDTLAKVAAAAAGVPTAQNDSPARTEHHPSAPQGQQSTIHKEIRDDISRFTHKLSANPLPQTIDDNPVSVITLAGENTGATMHIGSESAKKGSPVRIHRGYKLNPEETSEATTTDGETSDNRRFKHPKAGDDSSHTTYINGNTQTVNNSIISNSSITVGCPGVHVVFTECPNEPMKPNVEARKADFNVTQPQKLTYEPVVRRRCLRGLMLESSESDRDNPDKPRRHGCRYTCGEKPKARENGNDF